MDDLLAYLGLSAPEDLFADIPPSVRTGGLDLPGPTDDRSVEKRVRTLLAKNESFFDRPSFLPVLKPHYVPAVVDEIVARHEFYTAYTPYQPEASQGILQAMFEYQSVVAELTGMDAANVSMYDSATALSEALLMAARITRKKKMLIPQAMFPPKKSVVRNYAQGAGLEILEVDCDGNGQLDLTVRENDVAAVYLENPSFFGTLENRYDDVVALKERLNAVLIAGVDPLSLALVHPPSRYEADIVVGEGYLGQPMNYGGPLLGLFACRKRFLRQMPGRIIGATADFRGRRAFCMTMQTREQHIRRDKATSNICSNQALNCLAFLAYVAAMGRTGLQRVACENRDNARYMADRLRAAGFAPAFAAPFFNEFTVRCPIPVDRVSQTLYDSGMWGGLPVTEHVENGMLFGVTELHERPLIDRAVAVLADAAEGHP
jgi:glycine dehydrogenase subunit 1